MIYFVKDVLGGSIKIGTSARLTVRLPQIAKEVSIPLDGLKVLAVMDGSFAEERALHEKFAGQRMQGEWFSPSHELLTLIENEGRAWDGEDEILANSQARLELPAKEMDRLRRAAKSIGLSLSAFIRQAVLEKTVDVERRMGL